MILVTLGTSQASDTNSAPTLARVCVADVTQGSGGMTITTSASGLDIAKAILALGAASSDILLLATTLPCLSITSRANRSELVTITGCNHNSMKQTLLSRS